MRKLVYLGIGLVMSTMLAGCGGRLTQENAAKNQTVPIDSIMKNITIDPKTYFKTLHQLSFSLTVKDVKNAPIAGAFVNIHEQGQTTAVFQGKVNSAGEVSALIIVLAGNKTLVVEVAAPGYNKTTEIIPINNSDETIVHVSTLRSGDITSFTDTETDTDGDTVPDWIDSYPTNPTLAYKFGIPPLYLAYEDMYPSHGDQDWNDLVVKVEVYTVWTPDATLAQITGNAELMARGADARYKSDFHLNLCFKQKTTGTTYLKVYNPSGTIVSTNIANFAGNKMDMNLLVNTGTLFTAQNPALINTQASQPYYKGSKTEFTIDITSELFYSNAWVDIFDPYLMVQNPNGLYDIHLPFKKPITDSNNPAGCKADFIDDNQFPFCMQVPITYAWPLERMNIANAYPDYVEYIKSGFTTHLNWYDNPVASKVYTKHLQPAFGKDENFLFYDDFSDGIYLDKWEVFGSNHFLVVENGNMLHMSTTEKNSSGTLGSLSFELPEKAVVEFSFNKTGRGQDCIGLQKKNNNAFEYTMIYLAFDTYDWPYVFRYVGDGTNNKDIFGETANYMNRWVTGKLEKNGNEYKWYLDNILISTQVVVSSGQYRITLNQSDPVWKDGTCNILWGPISVKKVN